MNAFFSGTAGSLILYALYGLFSQNAVLGRGLGSSRLTKLVNDDDGDTRIFSVLLLTVQLLSGVFGWLGNTFLLPLFGPSKLHFRALVLIVGVILAFFLHFFFIVEFFPSEKAKRIIKQLPVAAFNCCILGTLLLAATKNYTLLQTLAFCLGSSLGFVLAILLMTEGSRKLADADMPQSFRGLPATLVYLGILSLIIYGFTGHMLAV